jgi:hypothetical protein
VVIRAVKQENGRSRDVAWVPFGGWAMGFAIEIIRVRVGGARLGRAWFGGGEIVCRTLIVVGVPKSSPRLPDIVTASSHGGGTRWVESVRQWQLLRYITCLRALCMYYPKDTANRDSHLRNREEPQDGI